MEKIFSLPLVVLCILSCLFVSSRSEEAQHLVTAMFIFGDSIMDCGNNNNFNGTNVHVNHPPYGIDFPMQGATGRFTNGYTIADLTDMELDLPFAPPYFTSSDEDRRKAVGGFNFASGFAGILPQTGSAHGPVLDIKTQVKLFNESVDKYIRPMFNGSVMGAFHVYMERAIFLVNVGSNDYLDNYLMPEQYNTSKLLNEEQFADLLATELGKSLKDLYDLGARKFVVFQIGPLGCTPLLIKQLKPESECAENINKMVTLFNTKLEYQLGHLGFLLNQSYFMTGNVYNLTQDILQHPSRYELSETRKACCADAKGECSQKALPCSQRDSYFFWDQLHPTETVNRIIARECSTNNTVCYPMNLDWLVSL